MFDRAWKTPLVNLVPTESPLGPESKAAKDAFMQRQREWDEDQDAMRALMAAR